MSYQQEIFGNFVKTAIKNASNPVTNRILLEIPDITKGCNNSKSHPDACPLILAQDYSVRQVDSLKTRGENAPISPPLVLWAMEGSSAYVKLVDLCWQAKTLDTAVISRLNQTGGKDEVAYKTTYTTMRIVETTEILIGENWFAVIMAKVGEMKKEQQSFDLKGASAGKVAAGANFITGEFGK